MKFNSRLVCLVGLPFVLSGCMKEDPSLTQSGFGVGNAQSNIVIRSVSNDLGTVTARTGTNPASGFVAYAELAPTSGAIDPTSTSGEAVMFGSYEVLGWDPVYSIDDSSVNGLSNHESGSILLTADFAAGTLTGSTSSGSLSVNGAFAAGSNNLSGNVTYDGTDGNLTGLITNTEALGAFHGSTKSEVFSGGFAVSSP